MEIIVYGACCATCDATYTAVRDAAAAIDSDITVKQVGDIMEILRNHIIQTPTVVINGQIVSGGQHLSVNDAKKLIAEYYNK